MERRENLDVEDVNVINGSEILNKYQSSFMFLFVCLFLFFYGEDGCVAGASARDYKTGALHSLILKLISTGQLVKWVLSNVGRKHLDLFEFFIKSAE